MARHPPSPATSPLVLKLVAPAHTSTATDAESPGAPARLAGPLLCFGGLPPVRGYSMARAPAYASSSRAATHPWWLKVSMLSGFVETGGTTTPAGI